MLSFENAKSLVLESAKAIKKTKEISIQNIQAYVLAEDIKADRDYPPFNRATMDGYCLSSKDFNKNPNSEFSVEDSIFAGENKDYTIPSESCLKIMTGAPVPAAADCVIQKELSSTTKENKVQFDLEKLSPYNNIARQGEDFLKDEIVLEKYRQCFFPEISLLAALGKNKIQVIAPPKVILLSTGSEIYPVDSKLEEWQIRDSNSYSISSMLLRYNIIPEKIRIIRDNKKDLHNAISESLEQADILILSGGVSKGDADYVPEILEQNNVKKIFHGVKIKPGKPVWFGQKKEKTVFALPGNPFSAQVAYRIYIEPFIRKTLNLPSLEIMHIALAEDREQKTKRPEFFPVSIKASKANNSPELYPQFFNGSGDISSVLNSNGLSFHPSEKNTLKKGELLPFLPWSFQ